MSVGRTAWTCVAGLACACGPTPGAVDTDHATDTAGTTGPGDASGSDTAEPACAARTDATLDWQKHAGEDPLPATGRDVAVAIDGAGRTVVATTDEIETDTDVLVAQMQPDGSTRWVLRYEGPAGLRDDVLGVAVDPDGLVYVAVREQTRELVSEGFGYEAEHAVVVLAIDADGGKRWRLVREIAPGPYGDNARTGAIAVGPSGDVIVVDADAVGAEIPPSFLRLDRFGNERLRVDLPIDLFDVASVRVAATPEGGTWIATAKYQESRVMRLDAAGVIVLDEPFAGDVRVTALAAGEADEAYVLGAVGDAEAGDGGFQLSRHEPDGTVTWGMTMTFASGDGYPAGVVVDCDGAPIVAAEISDLPTRTAALFGFTPEGAPSFVATVGEQALAPRSIARGPDGAIALGGLSGVDALGPWLGHVPVSGP